MISIIVPVYNASDTIARCLDSILSQSISDKEIIIVNDGSKDDSLEKIHDYAEKYKEIVVIDKPNGGVSSARNEGLKVAKGEYITFIDSDDYYLNCEYIFDLWSVMQEQQDIDLAVSGYTLLTTNGNKKIVSASKVIPIEKLAQHFYAEYKSEGLMNSLWNKLFKKEKITFGFNEVLTMGEDAVFVLEYLKKCRNVAFCEGTGYGYVFMNLSSTATFRKNNPYDIRQTNIYHSAILRFWLAFLSEKEVAIYYIQMRVDAIMAMVTAIINKRGYRQFFFFNISDMMADKNLERFEEYAIDVPPEYKNKKMIKYVIGKKKFKIKCHVLWELIKKKLHFNL